MTRHRRSWPDWTVLALVAGVLILAFAVFLTFGADWADHGSVWAYANQQDAYPPWSREAIEGNDRMLRRALTVGLVGLAVISAPIVAVVSRSRARHRDRRG